MRSSAHTIAIVGRPNVGKSSLFNRMVGSRKAIVEPACGTTRDRLHAGITWKSRPLTVVDTGGFEPSRSGDMAGLVLRQLNAAIEGADIIFFVTDCSEGVTHLDMEFASRLRKASKKIFLVVNKADDDRRRARLAEFYELGMGEPYAVSAVNGTGIDRLLNEAARCAASGKRAAPQDASKGTTPLSVRVAIVGRPNVGKSSYLNCVLKEERVIVHPVAGTTRDAVDTDFGYRDREYILIDTAGMRHNTKLNQAADFYGSVRSREAVKGCDVALVIIDGYDGLREDDARVVDFVIGEGKGLVIAVNKWDLVKNAEMSKYTAMLRAKLPAAKDYPVVYISSRSGRNVPSSLDLIWSVFERSGKRWARKELKGMLDSLNATDELTSKRMKFRYLVQEGVRPPSFAVGLSGSRMPRENTMRYVENFIRSYADLAGTPIRIKYNT
jgi:GTP-binding protein